MAKEANTESTENNQLRIFVTAGDYAAGYYLIREAVRAGHQVVGTTELGTVGAYRIRRLGGVPVYPELTREGALRSAIAMLKADVVVNAAPAAHFNGLPFHKVDYKNEIALLTEGTKALLAAAQTVKSVKYFVHISLACLYGDTGSEKATEETPVRGGNILFDAAVHAETAVQQSALESTILRAGFEYGALSPSALGVIKAIQSGKPLPSGNGLAAWVHDVDVARAIMLLIERVSTGETVAPLLNIVDDTPTHVDDMLSKIGGELGISTTPRISAFWKPLRVGDIQTTLLEQNTHVENSKAKEELGWMLKHPAQDRGIDDMLLILRAETAGSAHDDESTQDSENKELTIT